MTKPLSPKRTGFLARLDGARRSLKSAERKVAEWVLAHPEELITSTITEVAKASEVAEATVLRFSRRFDFKWYQDLKITLARELVPPIATIDAELKEDDPPETIFHKVFQANVQALKDTLEVLDAKEIDRAAEVLKSAKRIFFIGVGTSGPNVVDAYNKFFRLGIDCHCYTDSHLQVMAAALLQPGDVVVAISHSGSTKDPIETLKVAKEAGATTICITNNALSPITKIADIKLVTASRETRFRHEALASRIAQTSIINSLFMILSLADPERTLKNTRKIEKTIVSKQY